MKLYQKSPHLENYLLESEDIDLSHPEIVGKANKIHRLSSNETDYIQRTFEFVRDEISHSNDIRSSRITKKASEVLYHHEGICYAKSNLLAALLRAQGIPTGFCYQRLTLADDESLGYCIHALNAVYITNLHQWVRLDT